MSKSSSEEGIQNYIKHMLEYTVRLIKNAENIGEISGMASGVIVEHQNILFLLTAGHIFKDSGIWTLETNISIHGTTLHLALNDFQLIERVNLETEEIQEIDLAWCQLKLESIRSLLLNENKLQGETLELPVYKGPMDIIPTAKRVYGFAAWNQVEFDANLGILLSEASYEIGLNYIGEDSKTGIYKFRLSRPHQGHDYYSGASGSPIADEEGRIVSLLLGGSIDDNVLFGIPINSYIRYFNLE